MVTCLTEVFIWSMKNNFNISDHIIGCHIYHDKNDTGSTQFYHEERQKFAESRDILWTPRNKRPEKLRDTLKEVEELLSQYKVIQCRWRSRGIYQIVLSNGCVMTFSMTGHSGDVDRILVDKTLVGKLSGDTLSDAYLTDQFMVAAFPDKPKLDFVYFVKRPPLGEAIKRIEKLSVWEPKISQLDLPGPVGRRLERTLSANIHQDMVLLWWPILSEEAMPWSPMTTDKERANLVIISVHGPNIDILTFTRTECDPLFAEFSNLYPERLYTVEKALVSGGEMTAKACVYDIIHGKIKRTAVTNIPLKSHLCCQRWSPSEDKLLLGCADGTLVMYDEQKKTTQIARSAVIPSVIGWHPTGTIFFVGSVRGDFQILDMALTPLRVQVLTEEPDPHRVLQISKFFKVPPPLKEINWCPFDPQSADWGGDYTDVMVIVFERGPLAMLMLPLGIISRERFSCLELVKEYIRQKQIEEAVTLLSSMNWDLDGQSCYVCLSTIVNHLLRMPLNADREDYLEAALGTFYAPKRPLSESTILDFRDPISRLARRFFHHLLRYARFDKAFLLAVDIGAKDLFMDLHYMALDKGETALAEVARRKAVQIESDLSDSLDGFDDDIPPLGGQGYQQNGEMYSRNNSSRQQERIPRSRQHPWQQNLPPSSSVSHNSSSSGYESQQRSRQSHRSGSAEDDQDSGLHLQLGELDLESDLIQDYTSALRDDNGWNKQDEHEDGDGKSVKVIHFGVV
ncbi:hypothetical protein CHS0354_042616 [Potamilus streckersoni]|uniref:WD repeat-containing and planar cell polarity effector protein fritz homolog n=1 Tax=Potamilus streckersoni TaxID=2493646 RepID=A0AAE0TF84_9BIVA|nr:hypothetical protein CHS0354_042616 [Potamilus streckersoni]